ncbi:MAG: type II secretion system protein [Betaproteobacteria bacterium]
MKTRGFTLIELMITVAIVALLASIALPMAELAVQRGKEQDLRRGLREIREAIDAYKRAADEGTIEKAANATGYPPTLAVLVEGVADKKNQGQKVYFLRRLPEDPVAKKAWGLRSYASSAADPSPGADVYDVFTASEDKGLNGVAYKEW